MRLLLGRPSILLVYAILAGVLGSDALASTTSFIYDNIGRLTQVVSDDSTVIAYAYDLVGNRTSIMVTAPIQPLGVSSILPTPGWPSWHPGDPIRLNMTTTLDAATVTSASIWTGGNVAYNQDVTSSVGGGGTSIDLSLPPRPVAGEMLQLTIPGTVSSQAGLLLGASYTMRVRVGGAPSVAFYQPNRDLESSSQRPSGAAVLDVDHDGNVDYLVSGVNVMLFLNDGTGHFSQGAPIAAGSGSVSIATLDANRDGWMDFVTANFSQGTITLCLNNTVGGFTAPVTTFVGGNPNQVEVGDFNNDGWWDVAVAVWGTPTSLAVCLNSGSGLAASSSLPLTGNFACVGVLDRNRDGTLDLVAGTRTPNVVTTFENDGNGNFGSGTIVSAIAGLSGITTGDFDRDGWEDVAGISSSPGGKVWLFRNSPAGLVFDQAFSLGSGGAYLSSGDLDGDGNMDLVAAQNEHTGTVRILLNPLSVNRREQRYELPTPGTSPQARDVRIVDLDGDDRLDMVVAMRSGAVYSLVTLNQNTTTGVGEENPVPARLAVQAIQGAAVGETILRVSLPEAGQAALTIFDVRGRLVRQLLSGDRLTQGWHEIHWNQRDDAGNRVGSGLYFLDLRMEDQQATGRVIVR